MTAPAPHRRAARPHRKAARVTPSPGPRAVPGFVVRGLIACTGIAVIVEGDGGSLATVVGGALVAFALATEALASIVYLRRRGAFRHRGARGRHARRDGASEACPRDPGRRG